MLHVLCAFCWGKLLLSERALWFLNRKTDTVCLKSFGKSKSLFFFSFFITFDSCIYMGFGVGFQSCLHFTLQEETFWVWEENELWRRYLWGGEQGSWYKAIWEDDSFAWMSDSTQVWTHGTCYNHLSITPPFLSFKFLTFVEIKYPTLKIKIKNYSFLLIKIKNE